MLRATPFRYRRGAGIVGLPNIGKSTLFNAISCSNLAKTGNYPFCTIDANVSKVRLYDDRTQKLAQFCGSEKIVDVQLDLSDVAGLIKGASKGEGLGNKFLNDIRPVNIILHMVRCFECHSEGFDTPKPLDDINTIDEELIIADYQSIEKRMAKLKTRKSSDAESVFTTKVMDHLLANKPARLLFEGEPGSSVKPKIKDQEREWLNSMQLLSAKPTIFVLNVDDASMKEGNEFSKLVQEKMGADRTHILCSTVEAELSQMANRDERLTFLSEYGIDKPASEQLLRRVYEMLGLQTFFTAGPQMTHAWTIPKGCTARDAAGEIHGDFAKFFKKAKVMPWDMFVGDYAKMHLAEKEMMDVKADYVMPDGQVLIVEHGAGK